MKNPLFLSIILFTILSFTITAQEVRIDDRLRPSLDNFFKLCESYNIEYRNKLHKLKNIAVVDTLETTAKAATLGMLQRDEAHHVENIVINWVAMLDPEILKIVVFHEFGHYFLEYDEHVCNDCGTIMSVVNSSYFDIANDWENQIKILFENAPAYLHNRAAVSSTQAQ